MAGRRVRGSGYFMEIEGLEKLVKGLDRGAKDLPRVMRATLRGEGGRAILLDARRRTPTGPGQGGHMRSRMFINDEGAAGVRIGYVDSMGRMGTGKGVWLESGTKAHEITAREGKSMRFGSVITSHVTHPGTRPQRIMRKSLKATQWEVEAAVIDAFHDLFDKGVAA